MLFVVSTFLVVFGIVSVVWNRRMAERHARFYHLGTTWVPLFQVTYGITGPMVAVAGAFLLVVFAQLISSTILILSGLLLLGFARLFSENSTLFHIRYGWGKDSWRAVISGEAKLSVASLGTLNHDEPAQARRVKAFAYALGALVTVVGLVGLIYVLVQTG